MKAHRAPLEARSLARHFQAGFTLMEMMVAGGLFGLVLVGMIAAHLGSLRFAEYVRPKIENSRYSRKALAPMIEEVRSANYITVGTGTVSTFTAATNNRPQAGNAIRIFPTTNLAQYIYYYQDPATSILYKRGLNDTNPVSFADCVTNKTLFSLEDYRGVTLSNGLNNAVLSILLQLKRDSAVSGLSDSLQISTKVTRRNIL
jgi:hypothetical protein